MKKHYNPYYYDSRRPCEEDYYGGENHRCGTPIHPDADYHATNNWKYVTCKRCLKQRAAIDKNFSDNEQVAINQMGDMAESFKHGGE